MVDELDLEPYFQIGLSSSSTLTGKEEIVSDTWEGLGQQLLLVLSKILEKLIQDALGWSLVIFWLALCLLGINWRKAWFVLAQGAWAPLVLIMVLVALAWSRMTPEAPQFGWKLLQVSLVVVASLFCGWLQGYFHWEPAEITLEPPADAVDGHAVVHH
jgi:hypothetical protein